MIQPRPYAIISQPCPEDSSIGCESCTGSDECLRILHSQDICWMLDTECPECIVAHEDHSCVPHCFLCEKERNLNEAQSEEER